MKKADKITDMKQRMSDIYLAVSWREIARTRHMMIDSSILGLEKTAKYIMQLIDLRFEN